MKNINYYWGNNPKTHETYIYSFFLLNHQRYMMLREQDRHFLVSIYSGITIIFIWKGLWEGLYKIPFVPEAFLDPWVFLFLGFAMLTFSKVIFKEFDPLGGVEKAVNKVMHYVQHHPNREDFEIHYRDEEQKKKYALKGAHLRGVERGTLVLKHHQKQEEVFVPTHRVTEVFYKGKVYWRL